MNNLIVSLPTGEGLRERLGEIEGVEFVEWNLDGAPPRDRIDLIVPPYWGGETRLTEVARVQTRLVQWQSIGYNGVAGYLPAGVPLANAATVHETATAELALALALAVQRGIPRFVRAGDLGHWQLLTYPSLADRRVLIVGYGGVGKAIEARLHGFEVASVTRLARTARQDHDSDGNVVEVRAFGDLHEVMAEADVVFLAVPLTDETRGMIDAAALAALPDDALLVNVARGGVVVTDALVAELQAERLRAGLDVTDPEPLPADHPLWSCPNTLISPHVGGDSDAMGPRITALIRRQIARLQAGEQPENLVLGS